MKKYIFSESDKLFKTNLHCHTTESDGGFSPEQVKETYKSQGYSVLAISEHEFMRRHTELNDKDFLILPAYEIALNKEGKRGDYNHTTVCHMNIFPKDADNYKMVCFNMNSIWLKNSLQYADEFEYVGEPDFIKHYSTEGLNKIVSEANKNGMFVMLNHPTWSMMSPEEICGFEGLWGMEIYNTSAAKDGFNYYETHWYELLLQQGKRLFCTATDDCHKAFPPDDPKADCCGGYIMVKADRLCHSSIIDALLKGDFYSSTGAVIYELSVEDDKLHIKCDPSRSIFLRTKNRRSEGRFARNGEFITEATFSVLPDDDYVRIETENMCGKRAFTNALFTDELLKP